MSVAPALLPLTTSQSAKTGGQPASGAEGADSFATLLAGVTSKTDNAEAAPANVVATFSTQLPLIQAAPPPADPTAIIDGTSPQATLADGAGTSVLPAAAEPAAQGASAGVTTPALAASTQLVVSAKIGTDGETAEDAEAAKALTQSESDAALALPASDGTSSTDLANADPAAQLVAANTPAAAAPAQTAAGAPAIPSLQAPDAAPVTEASEQTQSAAPVAEAETTSPQSPKHSPASAQNAGAAQQQQTNTAAPAIDPAATPKADAVAPTTAGQSAAADMSAPNAAADTPRAQQTSPALQSAPAATIQVYQRIIERADGKAQRFEVRLDPAELGRVDVRIEIGADKKVHAVLAAHDSAALSDLMRGQRALERALADAGIDLSDKGVRFELASDNGRNSANQQRDGENGRPTQPNVWRNFDAPVSTAIAEAAAPSRPAWISQRLDLVA